MLDRPVMDVTWGIVGKVSTVKLKLSNRIPSFDFSSISRAGGSSGLGEGYLTSLRLS
jgi:hypothetical protein